MHFLATRGCSNNLENTKNGISAPNNPHGTHRNRCTSLCTFWPPGGALTISKMPNSESARQTTPMAPIEIGVGPFAHFGHQGALRQSRNAQNRIRHEKLPYQRGNHPSAGIRCKVTERSLICQSSSKIDHQVALVSLQTFHFSSFLDQQMAPPYFCLPPHSSGLPF